MRTPRYILPLSVQIACNHYLYLRLIPSQIWKAPPTRDENLCVLIHGVSYWQCKNCTRPFNTKGSRNTHENNCKTTEVRRPYHCEHLDTSYPCLFRLRVIITFTYVLFYRRFGRHQHHAMTNFVSSLTASATGYAKIVHVLQIPSHIVIDTKPLVRQQR